MAKRVRTPIKNNKHVKELLAILEENGMEASDLIKLISNIGIMERQFEITLDELKAVRQELAGLREENAVRQEEKPHPVQTALDSAADIIENSVNAAINKLEEVKTQIIDGCKEAVAAFKDKGISALNDLAQFFSVKPALVSMRERLEMGIEHDQAAVAKIEAVSAEFHAAGRHLKNVGRTITGKEPIADVKPNGKLAKLMESPFKAEIDRLKGTMKRIDSALASLDSLEKAAVRDEKPSVRENMKELQEKIEQEKKEKNTVEKPREASVSL